MGVKATTGTRVLHVVCAGEAAGAERLLVDLARRPAETGAEHTVALFTPTEAVRVLFGKAGLRVHDRGAVRENPLAYLWRSLGPRDVAWLTSVMRKTGAQIAHLHTFQSHVLGTRAALQVGIPVLRTEHDTRYFEDPSCSPFTRWSLRRTATIVAIGEDVARYVRRTAPDTAHRVVVVRNGVDAAYFAPRPREDGSGGASRPFTFEIHCRLEPHKQVDVVLEAVARVEGAYLHVVGDGSERARLEGLAARLGLGERVRFHGYLADPRPVMAEADASISGARHEPLGLSVLEALAMGNPVVAFAVGGIPEIVQDGQTGWLAREVTVPALARCLAEAASDPGRARRMGDAARAFVEREARIEIMCAGYRRAYEALVPSEGSPRVSPLPAAAKSSA